MRLSNGEVLLHWPLDLHVLTQGWYYNDGSLHQAADWRTQNGTDYKRPVYAAEDGTVDQVQDWDGHTKTGMQSYGNMVRIKHDPYKGKTLQTRYAHLSSYCVKVGQKVKEGELIGYSGVTGNVFGAHAMQMQQANCCCETREAIQGVNYNLATQACDTRQTIQNGTRDIIENQNANARAVLDALTAQRIEAKDAKIAEQNQQIFAAQLAASQAAQNSYLLNQLRPVPVPAYQSCNPWAAGTYNGCNGCAC